jgi:hypothetical protein
MRILISGVALLALASVASAQFVESEPNDTKATANSINCMTAGSTIRGNSTSASGVGLDYYDVNVCAAPLGIYRHRLVITTSGTAGHTGTIRGVTQTGSPVDTAAGIPWDGVVGTPGAFTTDAAVQTSSTATSPARMNQWYGFGKQERFVYRVAGTSTTTADYIATMETLPVTAVDIGNYQPGQIAITTFGQGHTSDTDMWVYDSGFNAIRGYGNDDEAPNAISGGPGTGGTLQSFFSRMYAPGTYYLAISNFNLSNNQPSPSDDDFRTGSLLDYPDIVVNSSTTTNVNLTFRITDSTGFSTQVANTKVGAFDINWFKFTVVPEPTSLALLGLGALGLIRRRR